MVDVKQEADFVEQALAAEIELGYPNTVMDIRYQKRQLFELLLEELDLRGLTVKVLDEEYEMSTNVHVATLKVAKGNYNGGK